MREHVPPLLASVAVTTPLLVAPVAEQFVNAAESVIVGAPGTVKLGLKVTRIVFAAASDPLTLVVKFAV